MQKFIVENSPHEMLATESEYDFLRRKHGIPKMKLLRAAKERILIVRHPVERIQSLFVNKFIQRIGNGGIFKSYRLVTGRDPETASFREFVNEYVSRLGDVRLDPHTWPQHWHLCPIVYNRVFRLQDLAESMAEIVGKEMADTYFRDRVNPSVDFDLEIDAETRDRISSIYSEDFRIIDRIA